MKELIESLDQITIISAAIALCILIYKATKEYYTKYDGVTFTNYCKDISSIGFLNWRQLLIQKYYETEKFVQAFGIDYPSIVFPSSNPHYPFTTLQNLKLGPKKKKKKKETRLQKIYLKKLKQVIHRPNNVGYALDEIVFDETGKFKSFNCYPCTFKETIQSCFCLEYEIFKAFKKSKGTLNIDKEILASQNMRNEYHSNGSIHKTFTSAEGKDAMMSVQSLVIFKDHKTKTYKTIISKRSNKVSYAPNTWQFIPCGYFETYEISNIEYTIEKNFDPTLAILREFLEELFNVEEFIENTTGKPVERITNHPLTVYLDNTIKQGKAEFIFLGSVLDVVTLTHKLSYLLIIDDEEFSQKRFQPNFESKDMQLVEVSELHKLLHNQRLMPESAGLLKLAVKTDELKKKIPIDNNI
jgi:hypothetical protein